MNRSYLVKIDIDKIADSLKDELLFFQNDNLGKLDFEIMKSGATVELANYSGKCFFKRLYDGAPFYENLVIENGIFTCNVSSQILEYAACVRCSVKIYDNGQQVTAGTIKIRVLQDDENGQTYVPENTLSQISQVEQNIIGIQSDVTELQDDLTGLEAVSGAAVTATENAIVATDNAVIATGAAQQVVEQVDVHVGAAALSAEEAQQALSDLLAMIGIDIASLVGGKVPMTQIPATAIQDIHEVADDSGLTSLTAQRGDLAEVIELVDGVKTVTKTYQLLGDGDATVRDNWVVWGTSYAVQAGNATTATNAENANTINNKRIVGMTQSQYDIAAIDPDTIYIVVPD
ncbi:MAG: BppU family phage baseplate upper protein [Selenomonadaceae bacterium]